MTSSINNAKLLDDAHKEIDKRIKTEKKILVPDDFLKISRESKLYKKLAINMMLKAFEIYKYSSKKFSLNFFPEDLLDKELMDTLIKFINILDKYTFNTENSFLRKLNSNGII